MTPNEAISLLDFSLDVHATWWNNSEKATALNKAAIEVANELYRQVEQTEARRYDLSYLSPPPMKGRGATIRLNPARDDVWLILSLLLENGSDWVAARPVTKDQLGPLGRSFFNRPTAANPVYSDATGSGY